MNIRRTINIFLASSEEMENDRNAFGNLVRRLNGICEKQGIHIELFEWEDYDASYNGCRKQDEYNEKVRSCDMFIALFHIKAGKWTLEEFDVASEEYRRTGHKPKVYVYCRELSSGEFESEDLKKFKTRLFDEMGHYWSVYSNKDSMQLHFVMQLMLLESGGMSKLKVDNGRVMFMDNPIASMDKLRFVAENEDYQRMVNRLSELAPLIEKARSRVEKYPDDEDFVSDLQKLLNEQNTLEEDFDQYQQFLLDTAKRMSRFQGNRITDRMRRAMEAFEAGKAHDANVILDEAEKDADRNLSVYKKSREIIELQRQNVISSIEELLLKTSTIMSDATIAIEDRISQTAEDYAKADNMAAVIEYDKEKYVDLLFDYAYFLYVYGLYRDSKEVYLRLIDLAEDLYGKDDYNTALCYNAIGLVFHKLCMYDEALVYFKDALKIWKNSGDEDILDIATCYNNIGMLYHAKNEYDEALHYYEMALEKEKRVLGEGHQDIATTYNNIGLLCSELGYYDEALNYHKKALKSRECFCGDEHPDTAMSYNNIGLTLYKCLNYDEALKYYEKALKIWENTLGDDHSDTAYAYNNIGLVYCDKGEYEKALECYEKALKIWRYNIGKENHNIALCYNNIGLVYFYNEEYDKALGYYEKALKIWEKNIGKENYNTGLCYNNIGDIYKEKGEYDVALKNYEKALKIWGKVLDENHSDIAMCNDNIGDVYDEKGEYEKALVYYKNSLEIRKCVFGKEHLTVASSFDNIASVYDSLEKYDMSIEYYNKALDIFEIKSDDELYISMIYEKLGYAHAILENYDNALKYFAKAFEIYKENFGENHKDTQDLKDFIETIKAKMTKE